MDTNTWQAYREHLNTTIESSYRKNPAGSALLNIDGMQ